MKRFCQLMLHRACMRYFATTQIQPSSKLKKHLTVIFVVALAIVQSWMQHRLSAPKSPAANLQPMAEVAAVWRMVMDLQETVVVK